MSNIDSFNLTPIFGNLGFLKGYTNGLISRYEAGATIGKQDIETIQRHVEAIDKRLSKVVGIEAEYEDEDNFNQLDNI